MALQVCGRHGFLRTAGVCGRGGSAAVLFCHNVPPADSSEVRVCSGGDVHRDRTDYSGWGAQDGHLEFFTQPLSSEVRRRLRPR